LDKFEEGLLAAVLDRDGEGNLVRKSGVMGVVLADGEVRPGDAIGVELPLAPRLPLEPV
jgi:MOSC domain-containing protein YiiM